MSDLQLTEANSKCEVDSVQRFRYDVLAGELGIPLLHDPCVRRDVSSFDNLATSHHVLVLRDGEIVGAARLALSNAEVAAACGTRFGFELELEFALDGIASLGPRVAEIARLSVRRHDRGPAVVAKLYEGLFARSREFGVTHWLGAVDCQTSRPSRARAMHRLLIERGFVSSEFRLSPRESSHDSSAFTSVPASKLTLPTGSETRRRAAEPELATTIVAFTRRLGARALGEPAQHPGFPGRFVLPMLVELDAIPSTTTASFGRSSVAPAVPARRAS
jgi:predicted GNAT family N-acyltransferase